MLVKKFGCVYNYLSSVWNLYIQGCMTRTKSRPGSQQDLHFSLKSDFQLHQHREFLLFTGDYTVWALAPGRNKQFC